MRKRRPTFAGVFVAASAAASAVAASAGPAAAAELDVSPLLARIADVLADDGTSPRLRKRYETLGKALRGPDRPGLADDFARLERVAYELRHALAEDRALDGALSDAVAAGLEALDAAEAAVVVESIDVEGASQRRRVDGVLRTARRLAAKAAGWRAASRDDRACATARLAGAALARAAALTTKAIARQDAAPPSWQVALDGLDGALLCVHSAPDGPAPIYVVGSADATAGGGTGPLFLRGGAEGFVRVPVGPAGDLWWVDGVPGDGVWACGSGGLAVAYDPATGAVLDRSVGAQTGVLYGVWGSGPSDVWTVGEDPDGDGPLPAAYRWDGVAWNPAALPSEAAGLTLYKVWGAAADDVWACGREGLLLHFDGAAWTALPSGTESSLLTVHGTAPAIAVGLAPVVTERSAGGAWAPVPIPAATERLNGVRVGAAGDAWAVGYFRTVIRRTPRGWGKVAGVPATSARDFHAVTIDSSGGVWIAGGALTSRTGGALLHLGSRRTTPTILPQARLQTRVAPILTANCAVTACHAPPFLSQGLDLATAPGLRERLAGVASRESPFPLVAPVRPSASYLHRKLTGTHAEAGGSGDRMPQGEDPLAAEDIDAIRAWILEGAPRE